MVSFQHINRFKVCQIAQYCAPIKKIPYYERTFTRLYSFNRVGFVSNYLLEKTGALIEKGCLKNSVFFRQQEYIDQKNSFILTRFANDYLL